VERAAETQRRPPLEVIVTMMGSLTGPKVALLPAEHLQPKFGQFAAFSVVSTTDKGTERTGENPPIRIMSC
jgi:hypothetical protein